MQVPVWAILLSIFSVKSAVLVPVPKETRCGVDPTNLPALSSLCRFIWSPSPRRYFTLMNMRRDSIKMTNRTPKLIPKMVGIKAAIPLSSRDPWIRLSDDSDEVEVLITPCAPLPNPAFVFPGSRTSASDGPTVLVR